jgi:predicted Zn-dependent protease with MMP-like domain
VQEKRDTQLNQTLLDLLAEAEMALTEGESAEAENFCRDILVASPNQPQALFLLAEALRLQGQYPEAEMQYKRCVISAPNHPHAWAALSSIFFEELRWDEARRAANRALREDLWNAEAAFVRGALRERRDDYAGAYRDFARAWRSDPRSWPIPTHLPDEELKAIVESAIHLLHPSIQDYMAHVAIILEDLPTEKVLRAYEPPASPTALLGYFTGYAQLEARGESPWSNLPSAVVIYRRNIERLSVDRDTLIDHIRVTFFHEIGHLLGLDGGDFELDPPDKPTDA